MRIKNLYPRVKKIMMDEPEARNNDGLLTALVDIELNPAVADLPYRLVMSNRPQFGLPPCETIRRSRQKAQETTPELASDKLTIKGREEHKKEIEEFVRDTK